MGKLKRNVFQVVVFVSTLCGVLEVKGLPRVVRGKDNAQESSRFLVNTLYRCMAGVLKDTP